MPEAKRVYWDACVLLRYVNGDAESLPIIDALLDEIEFNVSFLEKTISLTNCLDAIEVQYDELL
jgi:hypothetical protein